MHEIVVKTQQRHQMIDITHTIAQLVSEHGEKSGSVVAFVPHTTAGITINENADPDVVHDILLTLEALVPHRRSGYRHGEGNSDAHVKAGMMGSSVTVFYEQGNLQLGVWQGIYFCEFDGPRTRKLFVQIHQR